MLRNWFCDQGCSLKIHEIESVIHVFHGSNLIALGMIDLCPMDFLIDFKCHQRYDIKVIGSSEQEHVMDALAMIDEKRRNSLR